MTSIEIYAENVREKAHRATDLFHNKRNAVNHYRKMVL